MNKINTGYNPKADSMLLLDLLNDQNKDLWNSLNQVYKIELEESPEDAYLTYFDDEVVVIEIDMDNLDPAAFTHELLHVYLKSKGVELIWDLKKMIEKDPDLREIISTSLRVHMVNCLEHVKMLPMYLSRGFKNEDFIGDYHRRILGEEEMLHMEQTFHREGGHSLEMVDKYIDKFFSMKASSNPDFDYSSNLRSFEKLDPSLYRIHQNFWKAWMEYQIEEPKEKYLPFLCDYLEALKGWKNISLVYDQKK